MMLLKEDNENLSDSYIIIATLFNYFFLQEKPVDVIERLRTLLLCDEYVLSVDKRQYTKTGCFHDELVHFKNFWYKPEPDKFDCPFDYFLNFVKDCEKHLKHLIPLANEIDKDWLKQSIKNASKITALKIEGLKNEINDLYMNTSDKDLQTEELFDDVEYLEF